MTCLLSSFRCSQLDQRAAATWRQSEIYSFVLTRVLGRGISCRGISVILAPPDRRRMFGPSTTGMRSDRGLGYRWFRLELVLPHDRHTASKALGVPFGQATRPVEVMRNGIE